MKINVYGKYKMNNDSLTEIVNLGGGVPLILSDGVIHRVKSLKAGTNVSLVDTGSEITINLTGGPGSSLVTSVNGESGDVVLTTADIDDSASVDKYVTQTQKNKIDFLTITQSVDLDALETKSNFITVTQPVDLNALEADSHTHANKAALDNVTQAQIDKVNFITITQPVNLDTLEAKPNIYENNGTLTGNRTIEASTNNLTFNNADAITFDGQTVLITSPLNNGSSVFLGSGGLGGATNTISAGITNDIDISAANIDIIGVNGARLIADDGDPTYTPKIWAYQDTIYIYDASLVYLDGDNIRFYASYDWANETIPEDGSDYIHVWNNGTPSFIKKDIPNSVVTVTADGTETLNLNSASGLIFSVDVGAITASTVTLSNPVNGGVYTVHFKNIATTVDVTWPVNCFTETGATLGTVQYTGGKMLTFYYDGTNFYTV